MGSVHLRLLVRVLWYEHSQYVLRQWTSIISICDALVLQILKRPVSL